MLSYAIVYSVYKCINSWDVHTQPPPRRAGAPANHARRVDVMPSADGGP